MLASRFVKTAVLFQRIRMSSKSSTPPTARLVHPQSALNQAAYIPQIEEGRYADQLAAKTSKVKALFSAFDVPDFKVFESPSAHYRCRCEFTVWHDGEQSDFVMYESSESSKRPVKRALQQFEVAAVSINQLMPVMMKEVCKRSILRHKLFQAGFHVTLSGQAMVSLVYHKNLQNVRGEWEQAGRSLRSALLDCPAVSELHVIGKSKGVKICLDQDYVVETQQIGERMYTQKQVDGAFSQPNGVVCLSMVSWAVEVTKECGGDLLEAVFGGACTFCMRSPAFGGGLNVQLYCGNGNFTIPLAANFRRVVATEVCKTDRGEALISMPSGKYGTQYALFSEEFVEAWEQRQQKRRLKGVEWDSLELNTLLVDPPRAGLDEDTEKLLLKFRHIVYISCNPETLHKNLERVKETHSIEQFAIFDQFPFTPHIECGVFLKRKV